MHLTSCDTKDLPRSTGDPGKQFRRVVRIQLIQGATQTVVIEHLGLDPSTQQVLFTRCDEKRELIWTQRYIILFMVQCRTFLE